LPIRIYALAKELRLDSKALVDICTKAGVTGKGSALASLTDEELVRVKAFLSGGSGAKSGAAGATAATARAKLGGALGGKVAPAQSTVVRREDYIGPGGTLPSKIPVLGGKTIKPLAPKKKLPGEEQPEPSEESKPAEKAPPAIKLAPMPAAFQPPPAPKVQEPAPQKPDIKLPPDAIRAGKAGHTPLSEHIRKQEKKKKAAAGKKPSPKEPAAPSEAAAASAASAAAARERARKTGRAVPATEEEAGATLGGREQRQLKRKQAAKGRRTHPAEDEEHRVTPQRVKRLVHTGRDTSQPRKGKVVVHLPCTVRGFSEGIGVPVRDVLSKLLSLGTMSTINAELNRETCELLAVELGTEVDFRESVALEDKMLSTFQQEEESPEALVLRPPVVTFLGHVDHGKTSLLDRIINIDVASGEKGGITQHIRAYQIEKEGRQIAFVDTPGHEAFTAMRARGANCTDIAVLVVAADDGVMPQTEEAISHARAAGVPIVVALNKIDLPGRNLDRVYKELADNDLLPSEWGGDTELVKTSAVTGEGIDTLLETLLTVAELHEYKANPDRPAMGTCLEAELQENRGVVAKLLVQNGTLRVGDVIVCGASYGRVKAMYDTLNPRKKHTQAGPSTPVNMTGLNVAPGAGDRFYVLGDVAKARHIAEQRAGATRQKQLSGAQTHVTLENLFERLGQMEDVQTLNVILRADVRGSIEAIRKELIKLEHPEVQVKILQATVGGITEADVHLADASDAVIIGFNVVPDEGARTLAEARGVQVRRYDIIYQVTEDLKAAVAGMLKPEERELELGRALVKQTFQISRLGTIAGCQVLSGNVQRDSRVRVIRENRIIGDYPLESLRREKDDAREVRAGLECGMKLKGFDDLKEGDILEVYRIEEVARSF
jgi:translation initiation factor IF-2